MTDEVLPQKCLRALQSVTIMPINRKRNECTVVLRLMFREISNKTTTSKLLGAKSVQRHNHIWQFKKKEEKEKTFLLTLNLNPIIRLLASPRAFCADVQKILSRKALVTHSLTAAWQLSPSIYSGIRRLQIPRLMLPTVNGNSCLLQLLQHAIRPGC